MRSYLILALALFLVPPPSLAGSLEISPDASVIASPITARITVPVKKGEKVIFPAKVSLPEGLEPLDSKPAYEKDAPDGQASFVMEYRFMAYALGEMEFPKVEYTIFSPDGSSRSGVTGPAAFTINSVRKDPESSETPVDIRPPAELPADLKRYILPALALFAAALAGVLAWIWWSKRSGKPEPPPPPPDPPHVIALERLSKLKEEDLVSRGLVQDHFFSVSEILRQYVEGRYGAPAMERTTVELKAMFDLRYERKEKRDILLELLEECDRVKFANQPATHDEGGKALQTARDWVEATRPREAAMPENS